MKKRSAIRRAARRALDCCKIEPLESRITPVVFVTALPALLEIRLGGAHDSASISGISGGAPGFVISGTGFSPETYSGVFSVIVTYGNDNQVVTTHGVFDTGAPPIVLQAASNVVNPTLNDESGGGSFNFSNWYTQGSFHDLGALPDGITASKSGSYTLADDLLTNTDGMKLSLQNIRGVNLFDSGGGNSFDVSGWTGSGSLTNLGLLSDTLIATKAGGFTLSDSLLQNGADSMNLLLNQGNGGIHTATLTDTAGGNTFNLNGWTQNAALTNSGKNADAIAVTAPSGFTLTDFSVQDSGSQNIELNQANGGIHMATLTDTAGGNTFTVSEWSSSAVLVNKGSNADSLVASKAGGFTLSNSSLQDGGDSMNLVLNQGNGGIHIATLTDTAGGNTFTLNGWTGNAALANLGKNADALAVAGPGGFTLADTLLKDSAGSQNIELSQANGGIHNATLTDTVGGNTFDVSGWTQSVVLVNLGKAPDTLVAIKAGGFTLTDTSLALSAYSDHLNVTFASGVIQNALLTDTRGGVVFDVSGWTFNATLTNSGSIPDNLDATKAGGFTLTDGSLTDSADAMSIKLSASGAGFRNADLEDVSFFGGNSFVLSGWSGQVTIEEFAGNLDSVVAAKPGGFTLTNCGVYSSADGLDMLFSGSPKVTLIDTAGGNTFDFEAWFGDVTLVDNGSPDTITVNDNADFFTLTDTSFSEVRGSVEFTASYAAGAIQTANLSGASSFNLDGWSHNANLSNADAFGSIVSVSKPGGFTLTPDSLTDTADGMHVTFSQTGGGIQQVHLTDTVGGNTFILDDWTYPATLTNDGPMPDTISVANSSDFILTSSYLSFTKIDASEAGDPFDLYTPIYPLIQFSGTGAGFSNANLTDTAGGHVFDVSHWTHPVQLAVQGPADTIIASAAGGMTLTDTELIAGGLDAKFASGAIETANLMNSGGTIDFGGPNGGWSYLAHISYSENCGITVAKAGGFTVTNTELTDTADGMDIKYILGVVVSANLTDTTGGHAFNLTGCSLDGSISAAQGMDTVNYTDAPLQFWGWQSQNLGVVLTDSLLHSPNGLNMTLANIGTAYLTAAPGGYETLDASHYSGDLTLHGSPSMGDILIAGLGRNTLIGGAGGDRFVLNGHSISDTLTPSVDGIYTSARDLIDYSTATDGVKVNLSKIGIAQAVNMKASLKGEGLLTLTGYFADLEGTKFNDRLIGDKLSNVIYGGGGTDVIAGGGVPPRQHGKPDNRDYLLGNLHTIFVLPARGSNEIDSHYRSGRSPFADIAPFLVPESVFEEVTVSMPDPFIASDSSSPGD